MLDFSPLLLLSEKPYLLYFLPDVFSERAALSGTVAEVIVDAKFPPCR